MRTVHTWLLASGGSVSSVHSVNGCSLYAAPVRTAHTWLLASRGSVSSVHSISGCSLYDALARTGHTWLLASRGSVSSLHRVSGCSLYADPVRTVHTWLLASRRSVSSVHGVSGCSSLRRSRAHGSHLASRMAHHNASRVLPFPLIYVSIIGVVSESMTGNQWTETASSPPDRPVYAIVKTSGVRWITARPN